jgi:uncharacterized protein YjbI with pentapeptide repeats
VGVADKTLWDWLELLIVPAVLATGGFWFNSTQKRRELIAQEAQKDYEQYIQDQRAQDDALQAHIDYVSRLLIDEVKVLNGTQLQTGEQPDPTMYGSAPIEMTVDNPQVSIVIRARTLAVLTRLDAYRKAHVLGFLFESGLVQGKQPFVPLAGASLEEIEVSGRGASLVGINLSQAYLDRANFADANLSGTYLEGAYLSGANLQGVDFSGADLSGAMKVTEDGLEQEVTKEELERQARSLAGATMPDGSKHS